MKSRFDVFCDLIQKHCGNEVCSTDTIVDDKRIPIFCPYCESKDIKYNHGCSSTLVAGWPDPNHYWCHAECNKCRRNIYYQHHILDREPPYFTNVWFNHHDDREIIIQGVHNCCNGKYLHKHCGGIIYEYYTLEDGKTPTRVKHYVGSKRMFREFIKCDKCDLIEEIV